MGLDMYLKRKVYLYKFDKLLPINLTNEDGDYVEISKDDTLICEIGYWRKANAIHKWFVDNCNNGDEDCSCKDILVTTKDLRCLLADCKEVMENRNKAEEILPTYSGCFFGGLNYDEYYFDDVERTVKMIEDIFKKYPNDGYFFYEANW